MKKHSIGWVQALRGIAALMVVLCHSRFNFADTSWHDATETWLRPGAMGVDLFFLVSGFIMVWTTHNLPGNAYDSAVFLVKRFARIWPVYATILMLEWSLSHLVNHASWGWRSLFNSLTFQPCDPLKAPYMGMPYGIAWTLNFEAYFYLVFGLSMLAKSYRWHVFFGWMALTLIGLPLLLGHSVSMRPDVYYGLGLAYVDQMVNPVIWDFVAGVLVGLFFVSDAQFPSRKVALGGVPASVALAVWWASPGHADLYGILGWGGPLALMFAFTALAFKNHAPKVPRFLLWSGEISYSLYLTHLIAFNALLLTVAKHHPSWRGTLVYTACAIALGFVFATISNALLEKRLSEWVRRMLLRILHKLDNRGFALTSQARFGFFPPDR